MDMLKFEVGAKVPSPFFRAERTEGAVFELFEDGHAFIVF
jgi:hypothetical protein